METGILTTVILPLSLFIIMLGMGMSLVRQDFTVVLKQPKAFIVGLSAQLLILPTLAFMIITIFTMDPLLAVGLMILSFCPSGSTSNMFSFLAKGDLALSISLTAIISLICPFTIPFLANITMTYILGEATVFTLPFVKTAAQLIVITIIPVMLGMVLRSKKQHLCKRLEKPIKILSIVFLLLIIAAIVNKNWQQMPVFLSQVGLPVIVLNILAMTLGLCLSLVLKLSRQQSVTICYEVGIQNGAMAMLITASILHNDIMTIAPAIYGLLMFGTGALFGLVLNYVFIKAH